MKNNKICGCIKKGNLEQLKSYSPEDIDLASKIIGYRACKALEIAIHYKQFEIFDYLLTVVKPYPEAVSYALDRQQKQYLKLMLDAHYPLTPKILFEAITKPLLFPLFEHVDWSQVRDAKQKDVVDVINYCFFQTSFEIQKSVIDKLNSAQKIKMKKSLQAELTAQNAGQSFRRNTDLPQVVDYVVSLVEKEELESTLHSTAERRVSKL